MRGNEEKGYFFALLLKGNPEIIKSRTTGKSYISVKKTSVPSTFNEEECKTMIGLQFPGSIMRVEVEEPYTYELDSGEKIQLSHRYEYVDDETVEEAVFEGVMQDA